MCERPNRWVFNDEQGHPTSMFIRGVRHTVDSTAQTLPTSTFKPDVVSLVAASIIRNSTPYDQRENPYNQTWEDTVTFSEMGIDSLLLIDIMGSIKSELGLQVYPQDFYDHPTIREFLQFISSAADAPGRQIVSEAKDSS
jgi:acyl carrier protein